EPAFDLDDHEIAEDSGDGSYDEGGHGLDEAGGGGDGDESGDGSGDCAEGGGLAAMNPLGGRPGEGGGGGGEVGVNKGAGGQRAGAELAAGVEAEPANPDEAGSDEAEDDRVGRHGLSGIADALAEIEGADQSGDSRSDVDDGAAGEVEAGEASAEGRAEQAAFAPDHVGHGRVDDDGPEGEENSHGAELHALGEGSHDERRGNDGEHQLVDHEGLEGDGGGVVGVRRQADRVEKQMVQAADEGGSGVKREAVGEDGPENGDDGHHGDALHEDGQNVLAAHQTAIEKREAGAGHHQHERGADQHPGIVCRGLGLRDLRLKLGNLRSGYGSRGRLGDEKASGKEKKQEQKFQISKTHGTSNDLYSQKARP